MKKKTISILGILFPLFMFSQVGIGTSNPQGTFHVDTAKDNPATGSPSTAQQLNDFTIASDGKVGIGTSTPDTKLTITTPDNSFGIKNTNGNINLISYLGSGAAWFGTSTAHDFKLQTSGLSRLSITSGGNVGILNDNPSERLDVKGNIALSPGATASSLKFYENASNGTNKISVKAPESFTTDRSFTLPSNVPVNGYALLTDSNGNTSWGAVSPSASTLASIALNGNPTIATGAVAGSSINNRFFQPFDNVVTDPNGAFNISTGTYTALQAGNYLITAYIVPNSSPRLNTTDFYYPVNLEVRKNSTSGNADTGTNIMDSSVIRYASPGNSTLRYTVGVSGMVSLSAGDKLNLVIYLNGTNASNTATSGMSFPTNFTYAAVADFKALFSVTAL